MPHTLVLLRHGESTWNAENLFTGWVDVPLSDKGRAEAEHGGAAAEGGRARPRRRAHLAAAPGDHHRGDLARRGRPALDPGHAVAGGSTSATTARCRARTRSRPWRSTARSSSCSGAARSTYPRRRSTTRPSGPRPGCRSTPTSAPRCPAPSASRTSSPGSCRTGSPTSPPTCAPARPCWSPPTATACARWSSTSTSISDEDIAGLNIPTGMPLVYELDDDLTPTVTGGRYLDPDAAAEAAAAVATSQGRR